MTCTRGFHSFIYSAPHIIIQRVHSDPRVQLLTKKDSKYCENLNRNLSQLNSQVIQSSKRSKHPKLTQQRNYSNPDISIKTIHNQATISTIKKPNGDYKHKTIIEDKEQP